MKNNLNTFIRAILAGLLIGISALIYCNQYNPIGALCFSFGLITILSFNFKLYTGYVGYVSNLHTAGQALLILLGNFIGTLPMIAFLNFKSADIWLAKLDVPLWLLFIKAIICGMIIYFAVDHYHQNRDMAYTALCVIAFILAGAEHSIADMAYMCMAYPIVLLHPWASLSRIFIIIVGNAVGAIGVHQWRVKGEHLYG